MSWLSGVFASLFHLVSWCLIGVVAFGSTMTKTRVALAIFFISLTALAWVPSPPVRVAVFMLGWLLFGTIVLFKLLRPYKSRNEEQS